MARDMSDDTGKLSSMNGDTLRLHGRIKRVGKSREGKTVLIKDVCLYDTGEIIADHAWIKTKKFSNKIKKNLTVGKRMIFTARVGTYTKGYQGYNMSRYIDNPARREHTFTKIRNVELH